MKITSCLLLSWRESSYSLTPTLERLEWSLATNIVRNMKCWYIPIFSWFSSPEAIWRWARSVPFFFSFNLYLTRLLPLRSKISLTRDTWPRREQHWYTETHHTQLTTLKLTHIKHLHTDKLNCNDITRSLNIFTVRRAWSKVQIDMTVVLISQLHFSCVCNITMHEVFIYFIHYSYL